MKNLLIFFSIFIITLIAFVDAKDRIEELDDIAANTPSQVEMKQEIKNEQYQMPQTVKNVQPQKPTTEQIKQDKLEQRFDNFNKQRENMDKQQN